ncbi:hypothetical protein H7K45_21440 [Mycobacterium yunnanensis]|uniref:Uncharacterized protein n=1 Tax=Mycobacterium yunnanensis TaxID=368477 RepID=A0A9X2Z694_9MYCO|nr:hypothetical protein [Mycobacterium yunnanensis]MCV7423121.1 hypothetical protein [Mycobacterium yunnanensis]
MTQTAPPSSPPFGTTRRSAFLGNPKVDLWVVWWTIPIFYAIQGVIYVPLTRLMPPRRPDIAPDQVAAFFEEHSLGIKVGFGLLMVVAGFVGTANGLIAYQIRRMSVHPAFSYAFIATLAVGSTPGFLWGAFAFLTAVLRPNRSPEMLTVLYDMAFLSYIGSLGCFAAAWAVLGAAILLDKNKVYPKWFGYATIWQIVTEFIAGVVFNFHAGPFAWNGLVAFYVNTVVYVFWQVCQFYVLFKAIQWQNMEAPS